MSVAAGAGAVTARGYLSCPPCRIWGTGIRSHIEQQGRAHACHAVWLPNGADSVALFMTTSKRFWSKVSVLSGAECWLWTGARTHNGYGKFSDGPRVSQRIVRAHRFAWEITHGAVPEGLHVLHHCDRRNCCNPNHLFLGTNEVNVKDKVGKNRQARGMPRGADGKFVSLVERC